MFAARFHLLQDFWGICVSRPPTLALALGRVTGPQFMFTGLGSQFAFSGLGPQIHGFRDSVPVPKLHACC